MKKIGIIVISAISVAALLFTGCKPREPRGPGHMVKRIFDEISDELNLTESQTTQLLSIRDELIEKGREMHKDREKMHEKLSQLILSDSIDPNKVKAEARKKHARFGDLIELTIDRLAEFHATLTPEQKESLVGLMEEHKKKMKKHGPPH
jgi:Spy/CpxP family protein refolding chaperone